MMMMIVAVAVVAGVTSSSSSKYHTVLYIMVILSAVWSGRWLPTCCLYVFTFYPQMEFLQNAGNCLP